jgi:thiosulfate reductase cytochrome b subunit
MDGPTQTLRLKHLVAIRWFHWINFPLLFLMIWSGLLIYWAYSPYYIFGIHIFPTWFVNLLGIPFRLAEGMALHFFFMWLFIINGVLYVTYTIVSGEWRMLVPRSLQVFRDAFQVVLFDLHVSKELPPQDKYNAAQQIAYTGIVLMGVGSLLTGLAIYKPAQLFWLTGAFGGYTNARFFHFLLTMGYLAFFVIHIMQVAKAGWNNFRSMVMGYELVNEHE